MSQQEEQLINEIIKLINESNNIIVTGYATQAGNGVNITVQIGNASQTAYAINVQNPGTVNLVYAASTKQWVAYQTLNPVISRSNLLVFRKSRPLPPNNPITIKVLFYVQTASVTYDYYIGGDRQNPTKIYTTTAPVQAYLSSTGNGLNDWVVGVKFTNSVMNITPYGSYTCNEVWAQYLQWQGCGLWQYSQDAYITRTNTVITNLGSVGINDQGITLIGTRSTWDNVSSITYLSGSGSGNSYSVDQSV